MISVVFVLNDDNTSDQVDFPYDYAFKSNENVCNKRRKIFRYVLNAWDVRAKAFLPTCNSTPVPVGDIPVDTVIQVKTTSAETTYYEGQVCRFIFVDYV